jgi:hypothetical protein
MWVSLSTCLCILDYKASNQDWVKHPTMDFYPINLPNIYSKYQHKLLLQELIIVNIKHNSFEQCL